MYVYAPRTKETTSTMWSMGEYSLDGAVGGFQSFLDAVGAENTTCYCCTDGTDWEIGMATVTEGTPVMLMRETVLASSASGYAVYWDEGVKQIFGVFPINLLKGIYGGWSNDYSNIGIGYHHDVSNDGNVILLGDRGVNFSGGPGVVIASGSTRYELPDINTSMNCQAATRLSSCITEDDTSTSFGEFAVSGSSTGTGTALYEVRIVARQYAGSAGTVGDSKAWKFALVIRFADGVMTQIGSTTSTILAASAGASAWTCVVSAEDLFSVTGELDKSIVWEAVSRSLDIAQDPISA